MAPLRGFLARKFRSLGDDDLHDLACDAITIYLTAPDRCDTGKSSLWSYLCNIGNGDAIDLLRKRSRREDLLEKKLETDVEFWAARAKDVFRGEESIDARNIWKLYGHKLVTNDVEAKLLSLLLNGEDETAEFAKAMGLPPGAPGVERTVKQAKDRMLVRMKRMRDDL
jgi:DNA-directed RNA polymerase specialized sigma24 family protein